jgi:hypothetical protein
VWRTDGTTVVLKQYHLGCLADASYGPAERAAATLHDHGRAAMRVDLAALAGAASRLPAGGPVAIGATYRETIAVRG